MRHYKHDIYAGSRPFVDSVDVKCPGCRGKARASQSGFECSACNLKIKEKWYGPVSGIATCSCSKCGRSLYKRFSYQNRQLNCRFRCPICSAVSSSEICWFKRHIDGKDPYFGLDYYSDVEFKGHRFWIHNDEHKEALRVYIESDNKAAFSEKMLSSLPECVKSKSNKESLLKLIHDLD